MQTFYIRVFNNDSLKKSNLIEKSGYKILLPFGLIGYVSKTVYGWNVTESTTGLEITTGNTKKEAIEKTLMALESVGEQNVLNAIKRQKEYYGI